MSRLNLSERDREIVRTILQGHVPGLRTLAFGSRVKGKPRRWSDLDLMLFGNGLLPYQTLEALREAFMESDLPIRVDVIDGARVDGDFVAVALEGAVELH